MHRVGHNGGALRKISTHELYHRKAGIERKYHQETPLAGVSVVMMMVAVMML